MGFNPPVPQQDSNWEVRVAVLLSLLLQVVLIFLGPTRKRYSSPLPRIAVWSCYLLADWVADLALGLLLNNMGNVGGGGNSSSSFGNNDAGSGGSSSSPIIFAFWTPFLLLHLGGPDTITAYSLEDNELWLRHLIGLLFELFSAVVVISCSIRGNSLIPATILMLVAGVIKYGERTYSLYSGSLESFRTNILGPADPGPNYAKLMAEFDSRKKAGLDVQIVIANGEAEEAHRQANKKEKRQVEVRSLVLIGAKRLEERAYYFFCAFGRLLVDLSLSFRQRRLSQAFFLERKDLLPSEAFSVIELELNFVYDELYTKAPVAHTSAGWVLRFVCSGCIVSALVIFFRHDKAGFEGVDVGITYALLLGGLALDLVALAMLLFSNSAAVFFQQSRRFKWLELLTRKARRWWRTRRWSGTTSHFNLISYCLGKPDHYSGRCWHRVSKMLHVKAGVLEDLIFIRHVPLRDLTDDREEKGSLLNFVFYGLRTTALNLKGKLEKEEHIMGVYNRRGVGVVDRLETEIKKALKTNEEALKNDEEALKNVERKFKLIRDSVVVSDFDESLLLWHIATDLCFLRDRQGPPKKDTPWRQEIGKTLSEYMLYLLIKQTEMVSARTGYWLMRYRDTCEEALRFFGSMDTWILSHDDARKMLLGVNTSQNPAVVKGDRSKSVLFDAVILAKALRELDEELMWEVVTGVWGEMLTYTASKCRGTTHVRQLNRGGELITLVWFLMANMGLSDMYRTMEGDAKAKLIIQYW